MYLRNETNDVAMSYKRPDDDLLEGAIRNVIKKNRQIESQNTMTALVLKELGKEDQEYRVSGERIRRVSVERNILSIAIDYNEHDELSSPDICPVCGYPMEIVSNETLDDRETDVGRRCTKCSYQTGLKRRTPGRYTFNIVRSSKDGMGAADKISVMNDAEKLIKKAASMIENVTKGTEYGKRGKRCASGIVKNISSKKDSDSLVNLIRDMENSDPVWACPLVSIKGENRKDI
ncbi:MAG: hypothetical protein LBE48_00655 [Methanomassiliicoccaceae archaeon]|jgi:hypothetical protein|nr:hypothetical protein [Methanomassiliicoccaceae archaeon]